MIYKHIQHCSCMNSSGSYSDFNELGSWMVCDDCQKAIRSSFEIFRENDVEDQQELSIALMD